MSRPLTAAVKKAIFAGETDEVFFALLTLDHADFAAPFRVVANSVSVVSGGETFVPFPFKLAMPIDKGDAPAFSRLEIDNVDRSIVQAIRAVSSPISASLLIVSSTDPDVVLAGPFDFSIRDIDYDANVVAGNLAFEDFLNESFPGDRFTPANAPGLF